MLVAYVIGFILVGLYFDGSYAMSLYLVSLLIALIPLATSKWWFALPILILAYHFIFGSTTFAWLCIVFAPFHWISFAHLAIELIKGIFGIDND